MPEIRQCCENCEKSLLNNSNEARFCSVECTFCKDCAEPVLGIVCPNRGGGFDRRPTQLYP